METRVIYSAAANSLDSWDMENLKYLRKISQCNPTVQNELETVSYLSDQSEETVEELDKDIFGTAVDEINNNKAKRKISSTGSATLSGSQKTVVPAPPLEDCYLLDVVTVRNESVLAVCNPNPKLSGSRAGSGVSSRKCQVSGSHSSSASSLSSSSSLGSPIEEANFFGDGDPDTFSDCSQSGSGGSCGKSSSISTIIKGETRKMRGGCPFCCESAQSSYYYLGQNGNLENSSIAPTVGGEAPPDSPNSRRSSSPYYVRLRRDLVPSYTPPLNPPRNFGMNKQGQLVIDYSPNWDGLEHYVKNLSIHN